MTPACSFLRSAKKRNSFSCLAGRSVCFTEPATEPKWAIPVGVGGISSRFNTVRMLAAELDRPRYGGSPNLAELAVLVASIWASRVWP